MKISQFNNKLRKAGRIICEMENKNVAAAKRDVGHLKTQQYSSIAQRRVPKALHSLYGLPMRNKSRSKFEQQQFLTRLK